MQLPDFLIIGAMKAGTTSLFRDLLENPRVYMPNDKEPGNLLSDAVLSEEGIQAYARHYDAAGADQCCGDATTSYSKLPDFPGVAARARQVLGPDVRVVYLVREPVARIVSQHHHESRSGRIDCGLDEALQRFPRFLDWTRYATQLEPWIGTFGRDQVHVVRFDEFVTKRRETVAGVSRFLGVEPDTDAVRVDHVYNASAGKPVNRGPFERLRRHGLYRRMVRPMLPLGMRDWLRYRLLPQADDRPVRPSARAVAMIHEQLHDEMERLGRLLGCRGAVWGTAGAPTEAPA